ncbi:energy-coupling factor ABC transporter ATP-binding protein [Chroococcidiopsis sp. TS-821]|uniref:energy-coupling factor ABC transporter ATP-binding protein n=1 Tax=Chroococcidiopsis sp. TS-821 TaxID=1378066 RepID=UPI000CEE0081|nr:ATP-binding cassette domain-containing protein [Chroococcidiopsis sp. TS-821]PPS44895.1 cobalt ABC transporter [Chroococcidiopsis sp. TS-821]
MPTQLRLQQVSLSAAIGSQSLLQDISFDVSKGDRIAIVGSSGAGKTSLLRLLNRLSEPTAGMIWFENQDYRQIPVLQLRQQIVLVPQESKLLGMTVQEAIAYPLVLRKLSKRQIQQRVSQCLEALHIPAEWLDRNELQLSVGQRQLVAIARALVIQPKILLFDEPTSALDAGKSSHLVQVLTDLATTHQTTILMVNHQLEIAELFCTRVLHLQQGKLIQDRPSTQVDWINLQQTLIQAEAETVAEWG